MNLKLAKNELNAKETIITMQEIQDKLIANGSVIVYLHKDNSQKDLQKLRTSMEKIAQSVYFNEVRYGLDKDSFLYELNIIK